MTKVYLAGPDVFLPDAIHALDRYGCALVAPKARPDDIWHDLTAFETCVRFAAERLRAGRA